jgi:hypothetical protein
MTERHKDRLLEMIEQGLIDRDTVIMAFVKWTTDDDVAAVAKANEITLELEYEVRVEVLETVRVVGTVRTFAISEEEAIDKVLGGNHSDFIHDDTLETEDWKIIDATDAIWVQ